MIIEQDKNTIREIALGWHSKGLSVCLVPTMGCFHDGHLALMAKAREISDKVVVSLFVNPIQFGVGEDLDTYPKNFEEDCKKAEENGVDLLFCPSAAEMYQHSHQTTVSLPKLSKILCGVDRPVHFAGVTTVVAKLFNIVQPDYAIFGEKDFQQLVIIKQMAADLDYHVTIIGHPIVREPDGLAMSSRNVYLKKDERKAAVVLNKALSYIREETRKLTGQRKSAPLLDMAQSMIESCGLCSVDYLAIVDSDSLEECTEVSKKSRAVGAIKIGNGIRLIDNLSLSV